MRVIAGEARRLPLKTVEGDGTRPTTDRIKETLFNMLQNDIYGTTFLDLFSGSGGIGIEALSRGASEAYFVEKNKKCVECIEDNLAFTKLKEKATVMGIAVKKALHQLEDRGLVFDIIYMDPPYNKHYEQKVLEQLSNLSIINKDTIIIVEASLETSFDYVGNLGFKIERVKAYKTNKHVFISKREGKDD